VSYDPGGLLTRERHACRCTSGLIRLSFIRKLLPSWLFV
jgi:hypothetical protein